MSTLTWIFLGGFVVMSVISFGLLVGAVRMAESLTEARELLRVIQEQETGHLRSKIMDYLRETEHYG